MELLDTKRDKPVMARMVLEFRPRKPKPVMRAPLDAFTQIANRLEQRAEEYRRNGWDCFASMLEAEADDVRLMSGE